MMVKYTWDKSTQARTWWAKFDPEQQKELVRSLEKISEWVMEHSCAPRSDVWTVFVTCDREIWGKSALNAGKANCALSRLGGLLDKAKRRHGDWSYDQFHSMVKIFSLAYQLAPEQFESYQWQEIKELAVNQELFQFND